MSSTCPWLVCMTLGILLNIRPGMSNRRPVGQVQPTELWQLMLPLVPLPNFQLGAETRYEVQSCIIWSAGLDIRWQEEQRLLCLQEPQQLIPPLPNSSSAAK